MEQVIRPYGIIVDGRLELGYEVVLLDGVVAEIRPHTRPPEGFVLSPAFVNAHSHFEYRGMQGLIPGLSYWPWIRELTRLKGLESGDEVLAACLLAAKENLATGVGWVGEHSDRLGSTQAMRTSGLRGEVFQEAIVFSDDSAEIDRRLGEIFERAEANRSDGSAVFPSPHAYQTVAEPALGAISELNLPMSIHVAETPLERELVTHGTGSLAELRQFFGMPTSRRGTSVVEVLCELGLARRGVQFVHSCDVSPSDLGLMAQRSVGVAHCPRSNRVLGCPDAPVREMLDLGLQVGIGLDSAASSGPIDMFAEMQAALTVSRDRGRPVTGEEVWNCATGMGYRSFGSASVDGGLPDWRIEVGSKIPLIKIHVSGARESEDLIESGAPERVEWVS